jgi:hypothetical protein
VVKVIGKTRLVVPGVVLAALLLAAPAHADFNPPPPPPPPGGGTGNPPPPAGGSGDPSSSGGTNVGTAGNCSIVSSPSYLGMSCGDGSMNRESIKQILAGDPVPGCWDDKLTGAELDAMMLENRDGSTWYWHRCLEGVDKKTMKVLPGGVHFSVELISIKDGDPVTTLTHNQQLLVNLYNTDGTIPSPIAGVSPNARPRVGGWVSFFDGTDDLVTVTAGSVILRAHVASLEVQPNGDGLAPDLTCPGSGYRAQHGQTRADHPSGCWYRYPQSSAAQDGNAYPVKVTAHWVVDVSADGGATFSQFNTFEKSQVTNVPVTEIEALVVP